MMKITRSVVSNPSAQFNAICLKAPGTRTEDQKIKNKNKRKHKVVFALWGPPPKESEIRVGVSGTVWLWISLGQAVSSIYRTRAILRDTIRALFDSFSFPPRKEGKAKPVF